MSRKAAPSYPDQLRALIRDSGRTAYALGAAAGVSRDVITRFVRGERGVTLETAGRLLEALGAAPLRAGRAGKRGV